ncbi:MAG: HNH endonuclease [bacterium]|nr:HNH endonuclease [bacterium]
MNSGVLSQPTLVLNRSWMAIATTTVRHALGMVFSGSAKVIRPDTYETHNFETWSDMIVEPEEPFIRTVTLRIKVPEVIVLTGYNGVPAQTVTFTRRNLYKRDHNTCQYCGCRPGNGELSIDHVVPRSRGGKSTWTNCVLACVGCNHRKANRLPQEAGMRLLTKPEAPHWTPVLEAPVGRIRQSWERFVSDRYWNTTLEP